MPGRSRSASRAAQLAAVISFGVRDGTYTATVNDEAVQALLTSVAKTVVRAPRGARFAFGGGGPTAVIAAVTGRSLDARASGNAVRLALQRRASGASVPAALLATTRHPARP